MTKAFHLPGPVPGFLFYGGATSGPMQNTMLFLRAILLATLLAASPTWAQTLIVGKVVALADGDTLTVLDADHVQHKIRLGGIDTPERKQPFGQRAKQHLSDLVFGRTVEVEAEKLDRYGRRVGKVLIDGRDANLALVVAGLAWHYKKYQREQSEADRLLYALAEDEARARGLGLWRDPAPIAPWDWRAGVR